MIIGGAESYIITKSKWLLEHGHAIVVISNGGENVKKLPFGIKHVMFETEISPASFSQEGYDQYLADFSNVLLSEKIDVIEVHNTSPVIHVALSYSITKIPFLINILNERSYQHNPFLKKITRQLSSTGIIYVLTTGMKRFIEIKVNHVINAQVIPIPVFVEGAEAEITSQKYILSVCRMAKDKMYIKHLITEFGKLLEERKIESEFKLYVVGDGELFSEVSGQASVVNRMLGVEAVVMLGTVVGEQLHALYKNASLYVGMGTSLLLAASLGKACILPGYTTKTIPYAWGVWGERDSDRNVLAVSEYQKYPRKSFSVQIEELLNDNSKKHDLEIKAKQLFEEVYHIDAIMKRWEAEYFRIVDYFSVRANECLLLQNINLRWMIRVYRPLWCLYNIIRKKQ